MKRKVNALMQIVIADRHAEVRSALRLLLENIDASWSVIGEAADLKGLQACSNLNDADLVLLEWSLPGLGNISPAEKVRNVRRASKSRIVVLGSCFDERDRARVAGVDGFISKIESPEQVISLLRELGKSHA